MNRRDFLHFRQVARTAGQVLGAVEELQSVAVELASPSSLTEYALLRFARQAMATTFEVLLPCGTPRALEAAQEALDEIDRLESQLTVYRDDSEVAHLNRTAAETEVAVENGLFELFARAAAITQ